MRSLVFFCLILLVTVSVQCKKSETVEPSQNRKIVVFGSSVALGWGVENNHGWAFRLGEALAPMGYTLVNKSVAGNNTQALIKRFNADVVPEKADICIIALGFANEGLANKGGKAWKDSVYNSFVNGIHTLIDMCNKKGIKPIVTGPYPANYFNGDDYEILKSFNLLMENSDIPFIEFLGSVDDGSGHYRAGMFADNLHPNDIGHDAMFRAIPLGIFDAVFNAPLQKSITFSGQKKQGFLQGADVENSQVVSHSVTSLGSFTFTFWANRGMMNPGRPVVLWGLNSSASLRLWCPMGNTQNWQLELGTTGTAIKSDVNSLDKLWHHFAITYDYHTDSLKFYVDNRLMGALFTSGQLTGAKTASLGSWAETAPAIYNAEGAKYTSYTFHRVAFRSSNISMLYKGEVPKGSAEIIAPLSDKEFPVGHIITNLAYSNTNMVVKTSGNKAFRN